MPKNNEQAEGVWLISQAVGKPIAAAKGCIYLVPFDGTFRVLASNAREAHTAVARLLAAALGTPLDSQ
jgi:hypothetical protein